MKEHLAVATVLTVYGIETCPELRYLELQLPLQQYLPFTVLKLYQPRWILPASRLQQYLPFTVLKLIATLEQEAEMAEMLQQYLPFTVLKPYNQTQNS